MTALTYKQRFKRHLEGVELDPRFQTTIEYIDLYITENARLSKNLEKKEVAERYKHDPFFKWIIKGSSFTTPLTSNLIANLNNQVTAIEYAKIMHSQIYAPCDDVDMTIYRPESWIRQGCPCSTDVDIVINTKLELFDAVWDISEIQARYPGQILDINFAMIVDGVVKHTKKGVPSVTNNAIYHTYQNFTQYHPNFVQRTVPLDFEAFTRIISLSVLNEMESILPEYCAAHRKDKDFMRSVYNNKNTVVPELIEQITYIDTVEFRNQIKTIVMKLCQALMYFHSEEEAYDKQALAEKSSVSLGLSLDGLLFFLFRGTRGSYDSTIMSSMAKMYRTMLNSLFNLEWQPVDLCTTNCTKIDQKLFDLFMHSPQECTDEFADEFTKLYGESFGDLFVMPSSSPSEIPLYLHPYVEFVDQRSDQWHKLLKFYTCGSNTGVVPKGKSFIRTYYNLLRGCIAESLASNTVYPGYKRLSVGMLVSEKGREKAIGISPDLLLTDEKSIYPVEFKCITSAKNTAKHFRAISLARKQLSTALNIILHANPAQERRGLLVVIYADLHGLSAESLWLTL